MLTLSNIKVHGYDPLPQEAGPKPFSTAEGSGVETSGIDNNTHIFTIACSGCRSLVRHEKRGTDSWLERCLTACHIPTPQRPKHLLAAYAATVGLAIGSIVLVGVSAANDKFLATSFGIALFVFSAVTLITISWSYSFRSLGLVDCESEEPISPTTAVDDDSSEILPLQDEYFGPPFSGVCRLCSAKMPNWRRKKTRIMRVMERCGLPLPQTKEGWSRPILPLFLGFFIGDLTIMLGVFAEKQAFLFAGGVIGVLSWFSLMTWAFLLNPWVSWVTEDEATPNS